MRGFRASITSLTGDIDGVWRGISLGLSLRNIAAIECSRVLRAGVNVMGAFGGAMTTAF